MKRTRTEMDSDTCEADYHVWRVKREDRHREPPEDARCHCASYTWAQASQILEEEAARPIEYPIDASLLVDVDRRFTYHAPKVNQLPRYTMLRAEGHALAKTILRTTPKSREQALALTKLEEAIMFANAAIARHE